MPIGERSRGNEIGGEGRNLSTAGWVSHWELDLDCEDKGNVSAGNNGTKAVLKEHASYHGELGMEGSEPGGLRGQ